MLGLRKRDFLPVLAFVVLSLFDAALQWRAQFDGYGVLAVMAKAVCAGLALSVPMFWLGHRTRWIFVPLWCWLCFIETAEWVTWSKYHRAQDGDWIMILMSSSTSELTTFVTEFPLWSLCLLVLLCLALMVAGGVWLFRWTYPKPSWRLALLGGGLLVPVLLFSVFRPAGRGAFDDMMYAYFLKDTVQNYDLYGDMAETAKSPRLGTAEIDSPKGEEPLGVIVIGESMTRNSMHLYGYGRPTTPCLDVRKEELVVFRKVRATRSTTGSSLRMFLTEATEEEPQKTYATLSQWYDHAGYGCALISNQSRWGRWEGVESLLFSGCRTRRYLSEENEGQTVFDDQLVPALRRELADDVQKKMLFLHMRGSHFPAWQQYPGDYAIYPRDESDLPPGVGETNDSVRVWMDLYDNSIVFSDHVLGRLLDAVSEMHRPSFFLFFSDHGETPRSGHVRDAKSPDLYEIPFVVWFSPEYRALFPDTVRQVEALVDADLTADHLFELFLSLARVRRGKTGNSDERN